MRETKIYKLLACFDKYEINKCRKLLKSPYFNGDETLVVFFDLLAEDINSNKPKKLDKASIWQHLNPDKPFNDTRFRKYSSDLLKLVMQYLAQSSFDNNMLEKLAALTRTIKDKKIRALYDTLIHKMEEVLGKKEKESAEYFQFIYQIEEHKFDLDYDEINRNIEPTYEKISYQLDQFYLASKLLLYLKATSWKKFVSEKYDFDLAFIEEIIASFKNPDFYERSSMLVKMYFHAAQIARERDSFENYKTLKNLLLTHNQLISTREAYSFYQYILNYCTINLNQGKLAFAEELFNVYADMIATNYILDEGVISPYNFKNIVNLSARLEKYDWAEKFVHNYVQYLPAETADNAKTFNLATLYYYKRDYGRVIELLRDVEYEDITYNLGAKNLLIYVYYETDEIDALYPLLDSFRVYLDRKKEIPEQRKNNFKNLIRFVKKLLKIIPGDKKALVKLQEELTATPNVDKRWLMEKLEELKG